MKVYLFRRFHQFTYSHHTKNISCSNLHCYYSDQQLRYHCHCIKLTSFGNIFLESQSAFFRIKMDLILIF